MWTRRLSARVLRHAERHRHAVRNVAWIVAAGAFVWVGTAVAAEPPADPGCAEGVLYAPGRAAAQPDAVPLRSVSKAGDTPAIIDMDFGDSREPDEQELGLNLYYVEGDEPADLLHAWVADGELTRAGGAARVSAREGLLFGPPRIHRAQARFCVRVDPTKLNNLRPGVYNGTVVTAMDGGVATTFQLAARFRASRWSALAYAGVGVLLGLIVKICTELAARHRADPVPARQAIRQYVGDWMFPVLLILGVLAGWLGYLQIYKADESWGAGDYDGFRLFVTCFGFQLGSVAGLDLARLLTKRAAVLPSAGVPADA